MQKITAKQSDRWSTFAGGVTGLCALCLFFDIIELRSAAIIAFVANCIVGIVTGKGVPSVQMLIQELNISNSPPLPQPPPIYDRAYQDIPQYDRNAVPRYDRPYQEPPRYRDSAIRPEEIDPSIQDWAARTQKALDESAEEFPIDTRAGW